MTANTADTRIGLPPQGTLDARDLIDPSLGDITPGIRREDYFLTSPVHQYAVWEVLGPGTNKRIEEFEYGPANNGTNESEFWFEVTWPSEKKRATMVLIFDGTQVTLARAEKNLHWDEERGIFVRGRATFPEEKQLRVAPDGLYVMQPEAPDSKRLVPTFAQVDQRERDEVAYFITDMCIIAYKSIESDQSKYGRDLSTYLEQLDNIGILANDLHR